MKETGVSLAYTVRALDAGPIIAYEIVKVDDHIKVCIKFFWSLLVTYRLLIFSLIPGVRSIFMLFLDA